MRRSRLQLAALASLVWVPQALGQTPPVPESLPTIWSAVPVAEALRSEFAITEASCSSQAPVSSWQAVNCLDLADRTVWAHHEGSTLDLFDARRHSRLRLARDYDSGLIGVEELRAELAKESLKLAYARADQAKAEREIAAQNAARQQAEARRAATESSKTTAKAYEACRTRALLLGAAASLSASRTASLSASTAALNRCREIYGR